MGLFGETKIGTLPLPPSQVSDLEGVSAAELAEELGIERDQAARLIAEVRCGGDSGMPLWPDARNALQLLEEERSTARIVTWVADLDKLLGGGVQLQQLTEFSGAPGIGKTQLAIQLAINVQLPHAFHGVGGEAVYIDSEGSFMAERAQRMCHAAVDHLRKVAAETRDPLHASALDGFDVDALLSGIHVYRVHNQHELSAAVRSLRAFIGERSAAGAAVRLVVIDSIAMHFRHGGEHARRLQALGQLTQALTELASEMQLAVVLINQVTTRVHADAVGGGGTIVPALGESWAHACNIQLMLEWAHGRRTARLYKGEAPGVVPFEVYAEGVRAAPDERPAAPGSLVPVGSNSKRPAPCSGSGAYVALPPPLRPVGAGEGRVNNVL